MTLAIGTICTSIAAISVSGVTIYDKDAIPSDVTAYSSPCLFPEPIGFVSNFKVTRDSFDGKKTVEYDLNYTFCHSEVGTGYNLSNYDDMADKVFTIADAVMALNTVNGAVETDINTISDFGVVLDPTGKAHHGCGFTFHIKEFVN